MYKQRAASAFQETETAATIAVKIVANKTLFLLPILQSKVVEATTVFFEAQDTELVILRRTKPSIYYSNRSFQQQLRVLQ